MRGLAIVILAALFSGCATTVPLKPVAYDLEPTVRSEKTATVELQTGIVGGSGGTSVMMVGNGLFVPMSTGPTPHLQFNEEDQITFIKSLGSELNRIGVLNVIDSANEPKIEEDVKISILFSQTHHNPNFQEYTLDVAMQVEGNGKSFANKYRVVSSEGDSWWTKMNTNASQGKSKAATKLIKKIIPDIERWVRENG